MGEEFSTNQQSFLLIAQIYWFTILLHSLGRAVYVGLHIFSFPVSSSLLLSALIHVAEKAIRVGEFLDQSYQRGLTRPNDHNPFLFYVNVKKVICIYAKVMSGREHSEPTGEAESMWCSVLLTVPLLSLRHALILQKKCFWSVFSLLLWEGLPNFQHRFTICTWLSLDCTRHSFKKIKK